MQTTRMWRKGEAVEPWLRFYYAYSIVLVLQVPSEEAREAKVTSIVLSVTV